MTVSELSVHPHMINDWTHWMLDMCHSKICRMRATLVPRSTLNPQREASGNKLTGGGKHLRSTVAVHVHVYYLHTCMHAHQLQLTTPLSQARPTMPCIPPSSFHGYLNLTLKFPHRSLLYKLCGILEMSCNVLDQSCPLILTENLGPEGGHLKNTRECTITEVMMYIHIHTHKVHIGGEY